MREQLREIYRSAEQMDKQQLLDSFRKVLASYDESLSVISENQRVSHEMSVQFAQMRDRLSGCEKENQRLKKENLALTEQLDLRKKDLFGRSTEKSSDMDRPGENVQADLDPVDEDAPETELFPDHKTGHTGSRKKDTAVSSGEKKNAGRKTPDLSRLPVRTDFLLDIDELDHTYGEYNWRIFHWESHKEIVSVPCAKYLKVTYTPVLSVGLEHLMERVPYKALLLPGSYASWSLVAQIMYDKFVLSLPLYRQEQDLLRNGIPLSRQTMSNWIVRFALDLFGPVYDRMVELQWETGFSQCDETPLTVIRDGRKAGAISYMWVHTTSELAEDHPIVVFGYELTRGTEHLRDFYLRNGYRGFLTSDAYISYDVLEKESEGTVVSTGCFMHCRRRFVQAILVLGRKKMGEKDFSELPEVKARRLIDEIYEADTPLKELSPEERLEKRNTLVRPKVDAFFDYIHSLDLEDPSFSDRFKDAVRYSLNQEQKLRRFLEDPRIPCDNGNAERSIRTLAVGRNSWLFCNTVTGAEAMSIIYSMTETAKANGSHPYYYLKYLLEKMPEHMKEADLSFLDDMMPWSEQYRKYETEQKEKDIRFLDNQKLPVAPKAPRKRGTVVQAGIA